MIFLRYAGPNAHIPFGTTFNGVPQTNDIIENWGYFPVFLLHGAMDTVSLPEGSQELFDRIPQNERRKKLTIYEGCDLMNAFKNEQQTIIKDMCDFFVFIMKTCEK